MSVDEETGFFVMGQGCPIHGDEYMRECSMCGTEFCRLCYPHSAVCAECAVQNEEDYIDEDEEPDFADVSNLDLLLDKNKFCSACEEDEEMDECEEG